MKGYITLNMYYNNMLLGHRMYLDNNGARSKFFDCTPHQLSVLETVGVHIDTKQAKNVPMYEKNGVYLPEGHPDAPFVDVQTVLKQFGVPEAPYYTDTTEDVLGELRGLNLQQFGLVKPFLIGVKNTQLRAVTLVEHANYYGILLSRKAYNNEPLKAIISAFAYKDTGNLEMIDYLTSIGYTLLEPKDDTSIKQVHRYYCVQCDKEIESNRELTNLSQYRCSCGGMVSTSKRQRNIV